MCCMLTGHCATKAIDVKNNHLITPATQTGDFCEHLYVGLLYNG